MAKSRKPVTRRRKTKASHDAAELARQCACVVDDKKGQEIVVLDLREFTYVTDFFVIASGTNPRQMRAMTRAVREAMKAHDSRPLGVEGADESRWFLLDYGDFIVHLFDPEWRKLYDLELLWGDAPRLDWQPPEPKRKKPKQA